MIDEEKTRIEFGYYSNEASLKDKVVVICNYCGEDRTISKKASLKSKMCIKCQRKYAIIEANKVEKFGRKHTDETKKKIGISNSISQKKGTESPHYKKLITEEHKEIIRISNKNRIWSVESREKSSLSKKGKKLSEDHKKNLSLSRLGNKNHRYGVKPSHGKGEFYEKNDDKIWMRSFWEIQIANYLDENNINWGYEETIFEIDYTYNNKNIKGTYTPDFYLIDTDEYIEVKGYWRDDAKEKFDSFIKQYPLIKIQLLMGDDIKKLGLKLRK